MSIPVQSTKTLKFHSREDDNTDHKEEEDKIYSKAKKNKTNHDKSTEDNNNENNSNNNINSLTSSSSDKVYSHDAIKATHHTYLSSFARPGTTFSQNPSLSKYKSIFQPIPYDKSTLIKGDWDLLLTTPNGLMDDTKQIRELLSLGSGNHKINPKNLRELGQALCIPYNIKENKPFISHSVFLLDDSITSSRRNKPNPDYKPLDISVRNSIPTSTLLIVPKENSQEYWDVKDKMQLFCPFCKKRYGRESIEIDDYVGGNILLWCDTHREILFCPTGINDRSEPEITALSRGVAKKSCSVRLEGNKLEKYAKENGFDLSEIGKREEYYFWSVGVLHINSIYSSAEDSGNEEEEFPRVTIPYHSVDVYCFTQIPNNVEHDGINLYYKADCARCKIKYENKIWGD